VKLLFSILFVPVDDSNSLETPDASEFTEREYDSVPGKATDIESVGIPICITFLVIH